MQDLMINMDLGPGRDKCHYALDILLTPSGDLAIVSGDAELKQRFLMYLATPHGERPSKPEVGCFVHDYLNERNTNEVLRLMEHDIRADMKQFPELIVSSVTCQRSISDDEFSIDVRVNVSQGRLNFLFNPDELMNISSQIGSIIRETF